MNEEEFVGFLRGTFPFHYGRGIGDDTSVVKAGDTYQLITTDILVENVHFRHEDFTLEELALKSLAVNLSDIAAMGGVPQYFYLGLGFPRRYEKEKLFEFFRGLEKGCRQWQVELAGGDYSGSPVMFISITVIGRAQNPIYRHNARTGDLIGITGKTGESAVGLKLLLEGEIKAGYFVDKHKIVNPEIEKGQILSRYVNAMIDLSDGLLIDLNRVLAASQKGARLAYERIPVTPQISDLCRQKGWDEYEMVLAGGEDYILLFTISKEKEIELKNENPGMEYYIIGEIDDNEGSLVVEDRGESVCLAQLGYDHFK
jgi:thiamine-monophosphate kinase